MGVLTNSIPLLNIAFVVLVALALAGAVVVAVLSIIPEGNLLLAFALPFCLSFTKAPPHQPTPKQSSRLPSGSAAMIRLCVL